MLASFLGLQVEKARQPGQPVLVVSSLQTLARVP